MEARAPVDAAAAAVVVVDLRERRFYDRKLMARFYDELMLPAFGQFADELESFDSWVEQLEDPHHDDDAGDGPNVALHVLLVLRLPADTALVAHHDQHQQHHGPPPTPAAAWREVASGVPLFVVVKYSYYYYYLVLLLFDLFIIKHNLFGFWCFILKF
jgi:hypothetical protein